MWQETAWYIQGSIKFSRSIWLKSETIMTYQWYIENMQQINTLEPPASDHSLARKEPQKRGFFREELWTHPLFEQEFIVCKLGYVSFHVLTKSSLHTPSTTVHSANKDHTMCQAFATRGLKWWKIIKITLKNGRDHFTTRGSNCWN